MSELERATCTVCGRELSRAEYAYCADHRGVLWKNAPLPPGHPGGSTGGDLIHERPVQGELFGPDA